MSAPILAEAAKSPAVQKTASTAVKAAVIVVAIVVLGLIGLVVFLSIKYPDFFNKMSGSSGQSSGSTGNVFGSTGNVSGSFNKRSEPPK